MSINLFKSCVSARDPCETLFQRPLSSVSLISIQAVHCINMSNSQSAAVSARVEQERLQKFLGTANVKLRSLEFPLSESEECKDRLASRFLQQGCRSSKDLRHRINATISEDDLHSAVEASGISRTRLLADSPPYAELDFPLGRQLKCLHGKAIIKAAEEAFDGDERWLVNLYLPG